MSLIGLHKFVIICIRKLSNHSIQSLILRDDLCSLSLYINSYDSFKIFFRFVVFCDFLHNQKIAFHTCIKYQHRTILHFILLSRLFLDVTEVKCSHILSISNHYLCFSLLVFIPQIMRHCLISM